MATLGVTNITISQIKTALGEISNNLSYLCKSGNINMFSKRKPVVDSRLSIPSNEVGQANNYGISVPLWNGANQAWTYTKPSGGALSPFRIGDFRGYYHDAGLPIIISSYTGVIHNIAYNSILQLSGISSVPDPDSPGLAIGDVLPGYFFAVQLKNSANEVVWGTNPIAESVGITIDFSLAPFNTNNWRNSTIELKFFMSSAAKTFAEADKSVIKKAIHSTASNLTTQSIQTTLTPFIEVEISGIRTSINSGTWMWPDGPYDPKDPPLPLVSTGPIALLCKFKNNGPGEYTISGSSFKFGTPSNYHNIDRRLPFLSNIYNTSGTPISGITIGAGQWSSDIILYDGYMLNWNGSSGQIPASPVDKFVIFKVYMNILGVDYAIGYASKRCASSL